MVGKTISHYRVLEKLGEGGMGVVYAARDETLGRRVALKFCRSGGDPQRRGALLKEARAAANLVHANIAQVYEIGSTEDGEPFIAMELVPGASLAERLRRRRPAVDETLRIVAGVASALRLAHERKVVHRDIKPSNIRITAAGEVKVLDFGLARAPAVQTATVGGDSATASTRSIDSGIRGTPAYMSPEQARGAEVDARSDLFSLGVVLYECLAGAPPFAGPSAAACLEKVLTATPQPPSAAQSDVDPVLDRITLKLLAKEPMDRYQSAGELLVALEMLKSDRPARRVLPKGRLWAAALILVAALLFTPLLWNLARPAPGPSPEARRWYAEGVAAIADGTFLRASKLLERATAIAPGFAMAHARLAEAWDELEYSERAKKELLTAMSPRRPRPDSIDAIRLRALQAALIRDYPAAVAAYQELREKTRGPERAAALVQLGRVQERMDRLQEAKEAYESAARADPQYAAPFLRLGALYVRQRNPEADAPLNQAMALYQAASNVEGITECLYQKARLVRSPAASLALLEKALVNARLSGNEQQAIQILLLSGDRLLRQGNTEKAISQVNRALDLAQKSGLENLSARCLIDRGRMLFENGDADRGKPDLVNALEIARRNGANATEARALANLGSVLIETGGGEAVNEGIGFVERALLFYRQGGYRSEMNLSLGILGRARSKTGDYGEAAGAFQRVIDAAGSAGPSAELAVAQENLAGALYAQGRFPEAQVSYEQARVCYSQLKQTGDLARTTAALASTLALIGRPKEAAAFLRDVRETPSEPLTPIVQAAFRQAAALAALAAGNQEAARQNAEHAIRLTPPDDPEMLCGSYVVLGLALTRSKSPVTGYAQCRRAAALAATAGNRALESEAALCSAEAALEAVRPSAASQALLPVRPALERAANHEALWRYYAILARSAPPSSAQDARKNGKRALDALRAAWPANDFEAYSLRPDIRPLLNILQLERKE